MKYFIILCITFLLSVNGQSDVSQNTCLSKNTCSECLQTTSCAWCLEYEEEFKENPHCVDPSYEHHCRSEYLYDIDTQEIVVWNRTLTRRGSLISGGGGGGAAGGSAGGYASGSYSGSSSSSSGYSSSGSSSASGSAYGSASGSIVQISPQYINLRLRTNQVHRLSFQYSQAEDYPVDLYYLMDLSKSMEDDKEKLSKLGDLLSEIMRNKTSNFRLGFGSFVDKVLMPYVSTVPKNLIAPCENCAAPYGYKNIMRLSTDTRSFSEEVRRANVSGNLDAPEGGFDAIMQAIVCRQNIGWREQARRLLVFSTDAGFHYAGDGKLGGVITPNDGECHLNPEGTYTHSTLQDYPSISQINLKVKQNAINLIFAVTKEQIGVYKKLADHVEGSSAAELSNDSSNVVSLVADEYDKISSTVEMKDDSSSCVRVTYRSSCKGNGPLVETNKCDGLKVGDVVAFEAEIVVLSCPKDPKEWSQVFHIYPVGIDESLTVNLTMICDCACEHPGHDFYEINSPKCSSAGTLKCGICDCNESNFGKNCECSAQDSLKDPISETACRKENSTVDCSGRGSCVCGVCNCWTRPNKLEIVRGKYCECDNFSCDRHMGELCSGHGTCDCGICNCKEGWNGTACECLSSEDTCINPKTNEICSGNGECKCGKCECKNTEEGRFSGSFCEKCPTCLGRCNEFKECVQCQVYKTGPLAKDNLCAENCTIKATPVDIDEIVVDENKDEVLCQFWDEDDCRFQFIYTETTEVKIRAQKERDCLPKVFILGIVLGVIAAIVLIGLAILLLWKLLTTISDRREFAHFEKERMMAKWDTGENPIYKQATSTFKNPTYAGK